MMEYQNACGAIITIYKIEELGQRQSAVTETTPS
jgi:hypothetical protein